MNTVRLVHDETKNYAYPWRDNFCEHRYFYVGQCPAGLGHQGEDIRPSACKLRNQGADRCEPYQDDVVAVRDGVALRDPGEQALYLVVDTPGEHIRFRYLHMNPHMLDAAGLTNGHALREGEVLGPVGDYGRREGGTTYHLHFDVQVPTRQGWLFVNPYMTLVAAYERLIGGRGRVVDDAMAAVAATPGPDSSAKPSASAPESSHPAEADVMVERDEQAAETGKSDSERETVSARHCQTRFVKGHRRRHCWTDGAEERERRSHAHAVRAVDRRVSHHGYGAWHHRGHLHARHGARLRPDTTGLEAIHSQPEFNEQLWQYLNRRVSEWRIVAGREKAKEYAPLFARIEKDFGVERAVMLGVWGIEFDLRRPDRAAALHAAGVSLAGDACLGRAAPPRLLGEGADQRALDRAARLEHAAGDDRLLGRRHGPHPVDAGGLAACRHRLQ